MAPYIFINAYFEEILDGFLAFFSDKFDMELLFRKNFSPDAAKQWFLEKGFILPEGFYEESLAWAIEKLHKTGFFNRTTNELQ